MFEKLFLATELGSLEKMIVSETRRTFENFQKEDSPILPRQHNFRSIENLFAPQFDYFINSSNSGGITRPSPWKRPRINSSEMRGGALGH